MVHLLPKSMIPVMLHVCGLDPAKKVNEVTRGEREQLVKGMKEFPLTINGLRDIQEAIITRGGVTVKEVDPSTMESKIVKNLYLAGEMLDLDALKGSKDRTTDINKALENAVKANPWAFGDTQPAGYPNVRDGGTPNHIPSQPDGVLAAFSKLNPNLKI